MKEFNNNMAKSIYNKLIELTKQTDNVVTDLAINEDGKVWLTDVCGNFILVKENFDNAIIDPFGCILASYYDVGLNTSHPCLDCQVPFDGSRLHINIPPATSKPTLSLRFHKQVFRDLKKLVEVEMLSQEDADKLKEYVQQKKNIIINGETGSGKSTLLSALLDCIPKSERVITIEDTKELSCDLPNIIHLYTTNREVYSDVQAVRDSLRMNPSRIIYGEVRDGQATLELLKAWNTGHKGGLCTIHANADQNDSISGVKTRLLSLTNEVSSTPQTEVINEVLEVIVQIAIINGKRKVVSIKNVKE